MVAVFGFRARADIRFLNVDQCTCGARSKKPTTMLCVSVPTFRDLVAQLPGGGKCPHISHPEELVGVRGNGDFRTAAAKQYPSQLCKIIAQALLLT
eukprot:8592822-Pyramimonas_sp.AAC.1